MIQITNNTFFYDMRTNFDLFRKFITQLLIGLHTLASCGIVHCDLKPENILVKYNPATKNTDDVKIVDFGAAFVFDGAPFLTVTTPEYLPPEFLQLFSHKKSLNNRQKHSILVKSTHPWSIDVWSLGVIILEMLVGIPVWMSFKCVSLQVEKPTLGLFSSPSRDHEKIADKIVKFLPNLKRTLNDQVGNLPHLSLIGDLLEQMLALDPLKRPSPLDLLGHSLFSV
jgi:dual specificity tyrosine-phosphorylation-regulated kinase 2/3/4